ncbi:hypothetical protein RW1_040_00430 [Rhodococcus wratislaviensis NBRC 100605]|uniref:Uncharacterized protein n=1 Tax=Rhodococcus wratislaviensis NBRC 100605 TaxID=1219028 RepID=X0Q8Z1_RHOWR|nr:hypothetical protein RW1_040_00430 [Rhodococcus wratislaviensis NBRC 100605]
MQTDRPRKYGGQVNPKAHGRGRPGTECAEPDCTELTRSAEGRCAKHRPMPAIVLHNGDWVSIGPAQYKADVARQIADALHDVLDRAGL